MLFIIINIIDDNIRGEAMIKVFGVGNILLCDEGVGVKAVEKLKDKITSLDENIEVIIGETDALYCIDKVNDEDEVIIVDSTYFMTRPGSVIVNRLEQCDEFVDYVYSAHEESLLRLLRKERRNINGYLIGIEISRMDYSTELSKTLNKIFPSICDKVYEEIVNILRNEKLA